MRCFLIVLAVILLIAAVTPAQAQSAGQEMPVVDLDFPGGTALEYIEAVKARAGHVNVVAKTEVGLVRIEPMELRQVDVHSAIYLLHEMIEQSGDRLVQLEVDNARQGPGGQPIYLVRAEVASHSRPGRQHSAVWAVKSIIDDGVAAEDLLTAVETAIEMFEDGPKHCQLSFHGETGLLIARGPIAEMEAIESVIDALREEADEDPQAMINQIRETSMMEIHTLRNRLEDSSAQVQELTRQSTEWQTRGELYRTQLDQVTEEVAERDHRIVTLEQEIRALAERLNDAMQRQ